eukprot:15453921-Alexandrium_andersonii.AAC.1
MICAPWPGGAAVGWCWVPCAYNDERFQWQQWQEWERDGDGEGRSNEWEHWEKVIGDRFEDDEIGD